MKIFLPNILILILPIISLQITKVDNCRFAKDFNTQELLEDQERIDQFLRTYVRWEANFIKKIGVDDATGLTLDGIRVDVESGQLLPETLHKFTASSKESIHLGIMAKVLQNAKFADQLYTPIQVFRIIQKKTIALQKFYADYPGFAGFLPWVFVNQKGVSPTNDFASRVPALDNGQMFWGALALSHVWKQKYPNILPQLRLRFDEVYWKLMIKNVRKVFYNETTKKIRAVADIADVKLPINENNYTNSVEYYLDDPYQGQMFAWIITLLAKDQFTSQQIQNIWIDKRRMLQSVDYFVKSKGINITVEKGYFYSSHEAWKNIFMPYYVSPTYRRIQRNGERVRTWNSFQKNIPGMYGAMAGPAQNNTQDTGYFVSGIQQVAFQKISFTSLVPPYGVFPLLLINKQYGAAWLHNTIYSPCGQTIYGALEGTGLNGDLMSPTLTWDTKITTVLAILNGTKQIIEDYLQEQGLLEEFAVLIERQYALAFPKINGQNLQYALPRIQIKSGRPDFTTCN